MANKKPLVLNNGKLSELKVGDLILATDIANVPYENIEATNVQAAINELDDEKLSVDNLSSNITLYSTTVVGDFGYYRLVTDVEDADYDTVAFDVPVPTTGSLDVNSSDDGPNTEMVGALIADAGLFIGNPGYINIPTIGNIRRQNDGDDTGNKNYSAKFYFKVYRRRIPKSGRT